MTNNELKL